MAIIRPNNWVSTAAYTVGTKVYYTGIVYECKKAVPADVDGNSIPVDNASWRLTSVIRIQDYYSLQEAIVLSLNTQDEATLDSIPMFIQDAERKIGRLLRSPGQLIEREFPLVDSKFQIPDTLLEIRHIRLIGDTAGYSLQGRGSITMQRTDRTTFEEVRQRYETSGYPANVSSVTYPVYRSDESYIYVAPTFEDGHSVTMQYYGVVPELGSEVGIVNEEYEPLNADGETLDQFIANGGGSTEFVQATEVVLDNLWTATQPHLLKAAAIESAYMYLKNPTEAQSWTTSFASQLAAAEIEYRKFDSVGPYSLQMESAYAY